MVTSFGRVNWSILQNLTQYKSRLWHMSKNIIIFCDLSADLRIVKNLHSSLDSSFIIWNSQHDQKI